jgi:hypothetical protein
LPISGHNLKLEHDWGADVQNTFWLGFTMQYLIEFQSVLDSIDFVLEEARSGMQSLGWFVGKAPE